MFSSSVVPCRSRYGRFVAGSMPLIGGEAHHYRWEVTSSNGQAVDPFEDNLAARETEVQNFGFTPQDDGTYWVRLIVLDGTDQSMLVRTIKVANKPPEFSTGRIA